MIKGDLIYLRVVEVTNICRRKLNPKDSESFKDKSKDLLRPVNGFGKGTWTVLGIGKVSFP